MSITVIDVAKAAGVSRTTVSNVFSGNGKYTDETRTAVLEAAKKLGYKEKQKGHSRINAALCDGCGQCAPLCKFGAIVLAGDKDA